MRRDIQIYLDDNPELKFFVRANPEWYRDLRRRPENVEALKSYADQFYGRTLSQKIDRLGQQMNMVMMMLEMANLMNATDTSGEDTQDGFDDQG